MISEVQLTVRMDRLFSPEFWNQPLTFVSANAEIIFPLIVLLIVLSMGIGWWLRGTVVKSEIRDLERTVEMLKRRVTMTEATRQAPTDKPNAAGKG